MPDLIRLEYRDVTMRFAQRAGHLTAVQGVSIAVRDGEVVSLIGPSATMPPSGALPAPTCLATSTPPRPTANSTSKPASLK